MGAIEPVCLLLGGCPSLRTLDMRHNPLGAAKAVMTSLVAQGAGASAAGIDSLFVAGGIHAAELGVPETGSVEATAVGSRSGGLEPAALERVFSATGATPTLTTEAFVW